MLTSRISLVRAVSSSRLQVKSPSRTRLAAIDSCLQGPVDERAISAAPTSDTAPSDASHSSQALPPSSAPMRERSVSSQYESPSIEKPTHSPGSLLTLLATTVPGPRREVTISALMRAPVRSG
jgi:hypothetical protein